jgi:hypothetical protein
MTDAQVCHRIPGRTRIRVPERRGDAAYFADVQRALAGLEGVERCDVNPVTGSLIIEHSAPLAALVEHAAQAGVFRLAQLDPESVPGRVRALLNLRRLDQEVSRASNGEVDLATLTAAGLLTMAAVQLVRGQILAPATTLLWYALATMHFLSEPKDRE